MKIVQPVNFAGRLYMPGDSVKGEFPADMVELLVANGAIESEKPEKDTEGRSLSLEEFGKLKADEQKSFLEGLNIQAAAKEDQRLKQYEAWLAKDSVADEL